MSHKHLVDEGMQGAVGSRLLRLNLLDGPVMHDTKHQQYQTKDVSLAWYYNSGEGKQLAPAS